MKKTILINDGISKVGKKQLIDLQFNVIDKHIEQSALIDFINENNVTGVLVRSATQIRKDIIDNCPSIKLIGRGGVGMDNIDVEYAQKKNIHVINTPSASSASVAELVFSHLFSMARDTYHSNRTMPLEGDLNFKKLKKQYSRGTELRGKKIGIIGFGKIGQEVAKIALGIGMEVLFYDPTIQKQIINVDFYNNQTITFQLEKSDFSTLLQNCDAITIHIPKQKKAVITKTELKQMKKGSFIINTSRGGIINEADLISQLQNGHIRSAALDVYENEPTPKLEILMNEQISLSPHIGAATLEAQDRIGIELAEQINTLLNG
tara:strand:- start:3012 stop:3971 length:960 start_codon:yes stop_codon:yes gene_type:complete